MSGPHRYTRTQTDPCGYKGSRVASWAEAPWKIRIPDQQLQDPEALRGSDL